MNHSEAVERMAAERYLLDELTPDAREAFEEHVFDCPDCALDLRAGSLFVREAKVQLAALGDSPHGSQAFVPREKRNLWSSWWRPAFVVPAFATLLVVVGYQNLVSFPALRESATEPRLAPLAPLHTATRGATHLTFTVDRAHGVALPVDVFVEPGMAPAAAYSFDLRDPRGKVVWSAKLPAAAQNAVDDQRFSLTLPGGMLQDGSYLLTVTSVTAEGTSTIAEQYNFDIVVAK